MSSAFKDGVDAGLSDFKSINSDLGSASTEADPANFAAIASIAGRVPDCVSRMQSAFERIGENLSGDQKSWSDQQKQRLMLGCDNMQRDSASLISLANDASAAISARQELGDPGDDEDKKSQASEADDHMHTAITAVDAQIEQSRDNFSTFYDSLRDVNTAFQAANAQAKSTVDSGQGPVDQVLNDMQNVESQIAAKRDVVKAADAQLVSVQQSYFDMLARIDDKIAAEKAADRAVSDGAKKDPPLSAGDLQNLEQAASATRQDRERAEADATTYLSQTVRPATTDQLARIGEMSVLTAQWSALKQRRDTAITTLNNARTALAQFNLEYQEPSL